MKTRYYFILFLTLIALISLISAGGRQNPDILYSIAEENHELALATVDGLPTYENQVLKGRAINIACEIAYVGQNLPEKYAKSREVACNTLKLMGANCWTDCDR